MKANRALVCGHRGDCVSRPEQTLSSYERAIVLGAKYIELDVRLSSDGNLVVIHDATLDRTTSGSGLVKDFTLSQIKEFDAGRWFNQSFANAQVPELSEVLDSVGRQVSICIEIKDDGATESISGALAKLLIEKNLMNDHFISSFNLDCLGRLRSEFPNIRLLPWMPEDCPADLERDLTSLRRVGAIGMFHTASLLWPDYVSAVKNEGFQVWVWSSAVSEDISHALSLSPDVVSCGDVDGVIRQLEGLGTE